MKFFKLALIFSALTLFIIACSSNGGGADTTTVVNSNSTNAPATNAVSNNAPQSEVSPAAAGDELASAGKIYTENCAGCHRENGAGGEKTLDDGTRIKAPNFASERMRKDKDGEWIETIENGAVEDGMPAYKGKLSDEEIKNLVKYIRREFQK